MLSLSSFVWTVCSVVGAVTMVLLIWKFIRFVRLYTRSSTIKRYCKGKDAWALVTGASDGIGLGFAQELAHLGFNVILHGRNPTKLAKVQSRLQHDYPSVNFRTVLLDAASTSQAQIEKLATSLQHLHITVLINNAGSVTRISPFELLAPETVDADINLNARFPTQLTRALLPELTHSARPSLILTIGSAGDSVVPYGITYGGAKAFNMAWSSSLRLEMGAEGNNVEVLAVAVGKVTGTSANQERATFWTPHARTMARAALQRVGCGKGVVVGYVGHAVQAFVVGCLPSSVFAAIVVPHMKGLWELEQKKS